MEIKVRALIAPAVLEQFVLRFRKDGITNETGVASHVLFSGTLLMAQTDRVPPGIKVLAFLMRRMPTGIRKLQWWWDRLYRSINGGGFDDDAFIDSQWPTGIHGPVRSRRFGYKVLLDLQIWSERRTYFSGSYFQHDLEYLFPLILRRGDQYLDIGANIGMTSLMASSLIGQEGKGFAFEPNPETFARLKRHFELNHTSNLEPVPFALSEREANMDLVLPTGSSGLGSLAVVHEGPGRSFKVRTITGRAYLERLDPRKSTVIKIDVEGHEVKALSGIEEGLDWPEVAIVAEVNDAMLRRAGDSAEALVELVEKHGFRPFLFDLLVGRYGSELKVTAAGSVHDAIAQDWRDLLFVKPDSKLYRERIAPSL
jgi:FkbM family methyltransferase